MPRRSHEDETLSWLRDEVAREGCASAVAARLGIERTLVWRISRGKAASAHNLRLIKSRRAAESGAPRGAAPRSDVVADLRHVLHILLQALDALDGVRAKPPKPRR